MNINNNLIERYINVITCLYTKHTKKDIIRQIRYELTDFTKYSIDEFMIYNDIIDNLKYNNIRPVIPQIIDIMENMEFLNFHYNNHIKYIYDKYGHHYVIDLIRRYFNTIKVENCNVINRILDYMEEDRLFIPCANCYGLFIINSINELIDFDIADSHYDYDPLFCDEDIIDLLDYNQSIIDDS